MDGEISLDLARLENVKHLDGGSIRAACPACRAAGSDKSGNHLLIQPDGKFGCATHPDDQEHRKEIFRLAGTRLAPNGRAKRNDSGRHFVCAYDYHDQSGKLVFQVCRYSNKDFPQRHPDPTKPGKWIWNMAGIDRILFRLPEVIAARKAGLPIFVCEGEKDVLAMVERGFAATCNPGGAVKKADGDKWQANYTETLRGADVTVIADKDQDGRKHAQIVAGKLHGIAKSVRVIELPDTNGQPVKDAADFFAAGGQTDDLDAIAEATPEFDPSKTDGAPEVDQVRRLAQAGEDIQKALAAAPDQWQDIAATARAALNAITEDAPPSSVSIDERIAGLWFDPKKPPPEEPVLVAIAGVPCATPGNITTITAQKKTGKTAELSAIAAAGISERGDTLGVKAFNPDKKTVLHFDTEQSAMDHWKVCDSILRRAQLAESAIFKSVCLTRLPIRERLEIVHHVIRQEAQRGNGLFIVLIDGHGDLVRNVNDPVETADYVAEIHGLAIETHCHIYGALHLNPGSDFKSRGHLGSELERKSQTNLRLEKEGEIFCVWGDANRGAPISKKAGPCFVWNNDARMHVSVASRLQTKSDLQLEDARMKVTEGFRLASEAALHYSELIAALRKVPGVKSDSTAERIFRSAKDACYISKNLLQQWQINP